MEKAKYLIPGYGFYWLFTEGIKPGALNPVGAVLIIVWQFCYVMGLMVAAMLLIAKI